MTLFEAAGQPGGQVRLATLNPRRKELIGIVDWRVAELERLGVETQFDHWAEPDDVKALGPDVVIVATGGLPEPTARRWRRSVVSSWDILSGSVKPAENVLLYDDNGGHQGMSAAEMIANAGSRLELVSPERFFAPEMGGMNHVPYMRAFHEKGVAITINTRLKSVRRDGNALMPRWSDFATAGAMSGGSTRSSSSTGRYHSTISISRLKPPRQNRGVVDYEALTARRRCVSAYQSPTALHPVPDRRRRCFAQHPRRNLRRHPLCNETVTSAQDR